MQTIPSLGLTLRSMVFAILIFYTLTTVALFKLRRERVGEGEAFRMPGYPMLPILYLADAVSLGIAERGEGGFRDGATVPGARRAGLADLAVRAAEQDG